MCLNKYSYLNTFEIDVFVFIFVFMEMKSIRILLKVFAPGLLKSVYNSRIIGPRGLGW